MKPFDTILFANDFSENSEHAFDYALRSEEHTSELQSQR